MHSVSEKSDPEHKFRALHAHAYSDVLRFVQRRDGPNNAEDIVADAYLVAWRRVHDLPKDPDDARAWLFGIARNCLLNARRSATRRAALAIRLAHHHEPTTPAPDVDALLDVTTAWPHLSDEHQEALSLSVWENLTSPQAAKVLGISAVAYRLRLRAARRALTQLVTTHEAPVAATGKVCHDEIN